MITNSSVSSSASRVTTRSELWRLLRPWRTRIAIIIVSILAAEALAVIPPLLLRRILDDYLAAGVAEGILLLAMLYFAATTAAEGMRFVVAYSTAYVAQYVLRDLRVRLFAHLQRLPLSFYDSAPLGDIISRCTADVDTVDTLFSSGVANLVLRLVQVAAAFAAMMTLSLRLSLLSLLVIPPLALITRFFQVHIRQAERRRRQAIGMLNVHVQETLSGIEVVCAFGREAEFTARFRRALQEVVAAFWGSESYNMFYTPILTVLVAACSVLFLWVGTGGTDVAWGLSIGTITAFILLFQRFFEPIRNLGEDWQTVQSALSGIERIVQVLQIPTDPLPQSATAHQQLFSLARALVWDPAVLLLDEATASIDHATEAAFRAALRTALQDNDDRQRTVITVAHRLSTAREADLIVLLDDGRIVEQGTPEELLRLGGTFAALVELEEADWDWREKAG